MHNNNNKIFKTSDDFTWVITDQDFSRDKRGKDHLLSNDYKDVPAKNEKIVFKNLNSIAKKYINLYKKPDNYKIIQCLEVLA